MVALAMAAARATSRAAARCAARGGFVTAFVEISFTSGKG